MNNTGIIAALVVGGVVAFVIALNVGGTVVGEVTSATRVQTCPSNGPVAITRDLTLTKAASVTLATGSVGAGYYRAGTLCGVTGTAQPSTATEALTTTLKYRAPTSCLLYTSPSPRDS